MSVLLLSVSYALDWTSEGRLTAALSSAIGFSCSHRCLFFPTCSYIFVADTGDGDRQHRGVHCTPGVSCEARKEREELETSLVCAEEQRRVHVLQAAVCS
eukprot:m.126218 g.126218  ORF g.126218 m.126218 type:complete len:100 (+) comp15635_c1_seq3:74-373(+)